MALLLQIGSNDQHTRQQVKRQRQVGVGDCAMPENQRDGAQKDSRQAGCAGRQVANTLPALVHQQEQRQEITAEDQLRSGQKFAEREPHLGDQ